MHEKNPEQVVEGWWEREERKNNGNRQGDQRRDGQKEEERRGEKRRKKRTRRRVSKEDVSVPFLWISSVMEEIWRVVVVCLGEDLLEKPEHSSDCEPGTRVDVYVVPDVTDVLVSPSSVVTECCDGFSFCSDWEFV